MEAGKEVRSSILCTFLLIFMVGLLREKLSLYYSLYLCNFWLRKTRVLQSSLGFLWTHVLMVYFSMYLLSVLCESFPSFPSAH